MQQVVQNYKSGELSLVEVPVPACKPGGVLIRTQYSLISSGTELMKVGEAKLSLVGKAKARPDQVRKVMTSVQQQGLKPTYDKVMGKLDSWTPLGYSLCGIVEEVGAGAEEFHVGQVVACAGNAHALHAEWNWVPVNLCVPVPDGVDPRHAAFTTVGSIAMQGLRQAQVQLGETAVVIGLGLIGQLLVQLLSAAGVTVIGVDVSEERCRLAEKLGASAAGAPLGDELDVLAGAVARLTGGHGADHVFLAAGGDTNQPVELAAELARDRGRIVDIGKCSLDLPWNAYYDKELDLRFSRSYGPGRYDDRYELEGIDYPIGYVRWTERRNLACFVDLLAAGRLDMGSLISHIAPFNDAVEMYAKLESGELRGVGMLFEYPTFGERTRSVTVERRVVDDVPHRVIDLRSGARRSGDPTRPVKVGFIGAGAYASSMLLPHLQDNAGVDLSTVVTTSSLSAANAQRKFGFRTASTSIDDVLGDDSIEAVFVVTRHRSHATLTARALEAGKAVFVEKPLAIDEEGLQLVLDTVRRTGNDRVMVGFNRRFSPLMREMHKKASSPRTASSVRYLVNAGRLDPKSWYSDELEGSRWEGEGGHFVDTVAWWLQSEPILVWAMSTGADIDDLHVVTRHANGSVAAITYATGGTSKFPKETFEVLGGGRVARLDNFSRAAVFGGRRRWRRRARTLDKGQRDQVRAFCESVRTGAPMPIPLSSLVSTTRATLAVRQSLTSGMPIHISGVR
jgi:predicted dehydrogenase/threonine dehydrogenase-like Zn-dependent dehydrogenase